MLTFNEFITESTNFTEIRAYIDGIKLTGRAPRGYKREFELLQFIKRQFDVADQYYNGKIEDNVKSNIISAWNSVKHSADDIQAYYSDAKPDRVVVGETTYIKDDAAAYARFQKAVKDVSKFLSTLKGYHNKPLKNLVVRFVKKSQIRGKAQYKTMEDEIWINLDSMGNTSDGYGSLVYVLLHELGHRYVKHYKPKFDIDAAHWITTKYSRVDSWSGEEKFAELFALSHFEHKYPEYKEQIKRFKAQL